MKKSYKTPSYPDQYLVANRLKKKKIRFSAVAEKLGLPRSTFSQKLHGYYPFKLHEVYVICDLLGVDNPREVFL